MRGDQRRCVCDTNRRGPIAPRRWQRCDRRPLRVLSSGSYAHNVVVGSVAVLQSRHKAKGALGSRGFYVLLRHVPCSVARGESASRLTGPDGTVRRFRRPSVHYRSVAAGSELPSTRSGQEEGSCCFFPGDRLGSRWAARRETRVLCPTRCSYRGSGARQTFPLSQPLMSS